METDLDIRLELKRGGMERILMFVPGKRKGEKNYTGIDPR